MRHLTPETLARIADGPATEDERTHLDDCAACRDELEALREQTTALAALPPPAAPDGLRERVVAAVAGTAGRRASRPWARRGLQAAAALALFVGGAAVGAAIDGPAVVAEREPRLTGNPVTDAAPDSGTRLASGTPTSGSDERATGEPAGSAVEPASTPVRTVDRATDAASDRSTLPEDPGEALREAEAAYVAALARYADERTPPTGGDPTSRLAALEGILYTTRAALDASPNDPVLEGFYRSAIAQRDAILDDVTITTAQAVY